ncbi:anoctamin-3-like isoform X2 [Tribolium madens]|uniref:anoctamin-3-like isoform X2 n=1 Tax=Tribolium madens TaxID=41895 RepID=UPI001CF758C8|nr:anoctamin-3-like isoform X2 [Tribolium madens]
MALDKKDSVFSAQEGPLIHRYDYVIILDRNIKQSQFFNDVVKYLNYLQGRGVILELRHGNTIKQNLYVLLHITDESVKNFASIYDINVEDAGHHYIHISSINLRMTQTPLSLNNDIFERKSVIATNAERILVLYGMLSEARFGDNDEDNKYGCNKLINMGAVKDVFPLHDGPYEIRGEMKDEEMNDRQLLLKYWANFSLWYKEQPLNLIEKYYGSEVAFYFAWLGFYNIMLIPAAIVGVVCFIVSVINVKSVRDDICSSELKMCPRCSFGHSCVSQPLKLECEAATVFAVFDNYMTIFFAVFMSFWATLFTNLWKRFESVLKIRWNVTTSTIVAKTQTRLPYKEKATHKRISPITGKLEHYTPTGIQIAYYTLSFGTCLLLVGVVLLAVLGVIFYRIVMAALIVMSDSLFLHRYTAFIEACSSSLLQVIFIKIYGKFYAPLSEWLTNMENPRTQFEFDNSVVHKRYILGFANNYAALFYMAFIKSRFYSPSHTGVISLKTDLCPSSGCVMPLCVQLFVLMLLKSMAGNILTLVVPIITKRFTKTVVRNAAAPHWEQEFGLYPAGRYLLTTEFMEMIIQYGFVTFFVAAFPLAPLCALINNCMELRLDAFKLVTRHRRPVPKKVSGIGPWKYILETITHLSVATNAFVLSFTTDVVPREIYRFRHKTLKGYVESTLSIYDMKDNTRLDDNDLKEMFVDSNSTWCYYRASRYPPDHPKKYKLTNAFWYEIGVRLLCVIVFEHVIMLTNGILAYFIPPVPNKIKRSVYNENRKHRNEILNTMHEKVNILRRKNEKPKTRIIREE